VLGGDIVGGDDLSMLNQRQLVELRGDLITSLTSRKVNLYDPQFANAPGRVFKDHARRIGQEESLLRRVLKLLNP